MITCVVTTRFALVGFASFVIFVKFPHTSWLVQGLELPEEEAIEDKATRAHKGFPPIATDVPVHAEKWFR